MYHDRFGHLPVKQVVKFRGGVLKPVSQIAAISSGFAAGAHPDGHVYPGLVHTRTLDLDQRRSRKVPRSDRPALLWRLPTSHELTLFGTLDDTHSRYGAAGFLIHLVGLLFGYRCQFHNWWVEGRVRTTSDADYQEPEPEQASACIERALNTWSSWGQHQQAVAINAMYLHGRTQIFEHEWERFQAEYQVVDAIYAIARDAGQLSAPGKGKKDHPHAQRIPLLCDRFGIDSDPDNIRAIIKLRNDLLHEALWDDGMPGHAGTRTAFLASYWLHKFARRAMLSSLGLRGAYLRSPWWALGQFMFDVR